MTQGNPGPRRVGKRSAAAGAPQVTVRLRRLPGAEDLPLPRPATDLAAGFDLRANLERPLRLEPGERARVPTGIALALPAGFEAQVRPRSGLALRQGVGLLNAPGTIDADYRGEIGVILINHGAEAVELRRGQRIAQLVIQQLPAVRIEPVAQLPESGRGSGGFGHTGDH